ncbi:MAG: LytTR family DNA-binding domain-containing protein [Bacteroidales bacterium]|nr:LytTR family DNA-binding domain-containing protein [Bacteroidales bacterium]
MRAIIVDDEAKSRNTLIASINNHTPQIEIVADATSVVEALKKIKEHQPDILFLDVQLPDGSGFDILELLPNLSFKIIFVSAYDKYAIEAFKFSAIDYLLKPVEPELLIKAVDRLSKESKLESLEGKLNVLLSNRNQVKKIALPSTNGLELVKVKDIIYCQADVNYTIFHLADNKQILVSKPLKEYDEILSPQGFYRIHQSYLIKLGYVKKYVKGEGGTVILENGKELDVSRRRKEGFIQAIQ